MADLPIPKDHPAAQHLDAIKSAHDALSNLFRGQVAQQAQMNSSGGAPSSPAASDLGMGYKK